MIGQARTVSALRAVAAVLIEDALPLEPISAIVISFSASCPRKLAGGVMGASGILKSRRRLTTILGSLATAAALGGCAGPIEHNEAEAAKKAEEFAEIAFARSDAERSYALLAPATKRYVSLEQFKHVLSRLHPQQAPKNVTAIEYEPMHGEKAIYIYLSGELPGERFYYRVTMEGSADTGYRVLKFERAHEPYAASPERKPIRK